MPKKKRTSRKKEEPPKTHRIMIELEDESYLLLCQAAEHEGFGPGELEEWVAGALKSMVMETLEEKEEFEAATKRLGLEDGDDEED